MFLLLFILINALPTSSSDLDLEILIVGGQKVVNGEAPYQVLIKMPMSYCGGTIISSQWILTAAHCLNANLNPYNINVHYNSLDFFNADIITASKVFVHENYSKSYNDIGLIKLAKPLKLNQTNAKAIALADKNFDPIENSTVTISGWGLLNELDYKTPDELYIVNVTIIGRTKCNELYAKFHLKITENMFCAGDLEHGGKDSCNGDSGGPVVQNGKLVGLVSWGIGCARKHWPGVYTRVGNYIDWIQSKMKN